jgi:hypothetical protein
LARRAKAFTRSQEILEVLELDALVQRLPHRAQLCRLLDRVERLRVLEMDVADVHRILSTALLKRGAECVRTFSYSGE